MVVKTITVTEDAYEAIKRLKRGDESFSELFRRLGDATLTLKDIRGVLKTTPEDVEDLQRRVTEIRKRHGEGLRKRIDDVRARLERTD